MATKKTYQRKRPTLTVTVDADRHRRLLALVDLVPGGRLSGVVDDMLEMTLPIFEEILGAFHAARRPDGTVDEDLARTRVEAFIGMTFLKMTAQHADLLPKGGEDST